jgi:hypothetical protein
MRLIHGVVVVHLLVAAVTAPACSSPSDTSCADCGPCGIAGGPNATDEISQTIAGKDASGVAALELRLEKKGKCTGEGADHFLLRWEMGAASLSPLSTPGMLDRSVVTFDGMAYTWNDRDLKVTSTRSGPMDMTFTFTEAGKSAVTACAIASGTIACTPM